MQLGRCVEPYNLEDELDYLESFLADRLADTLLDGIDWDAYDWTGPVEVIPVDTVEQRVGEAEGDEETVKLVKQVDGNAGQGAKGAKYPPGRTYLGAPSTAGGVVVDGAVTRLAGEPLVAVTKGWGDLTLMYRPRG